MMSKAEYLKFIGRPGDDAAYDRYVAGMNHAVGDQETAPKCGECGHVLMAPMPAGTPGDDTYYCEGCGRDWRIADVEPAAEASKPGRKYVLLTQHHVGREVRIALFDTFEGALAAAQSVDPDTDPSMVPNVDESLWTEHTYERGVYWHENRYAVILNGDAMMLKVTGLTHHQRNELAHAVEIDPERLARVEVKATLATFPASDLAAVCWAVGSARDIARDNRDGGRCNALGSLVRKLVNLGAAVWMFERDAAPAIDRQGPEDCICHLNPGECPVHEPAPRVCFTCGAPATMYATTGSADSAGEYREFPACDAHETEASDAAADNTR